MELGFAIAQWCITSIIAGVSGALIAMVKRHNANEQQAEEEARERADAMERGMRSMLRQELIDIHKTYVVDQHRCPVLIKEHAEQVYRAYHDLGGNGTGTHLFEEICDCHVEE